MLAARDKNGIVFFKDCFQRPAEVAVRGDPIDVWMLGVAKTYSDDSNVAKQCGRRSPRRRRRATWRMPAGNLADAGTTSAAAAARWGRIGDRARHAVGARRRRPVRGAVYPQVKTDVDVPLSVSSPCVLHRDRAGAVATRVVNDTHVLLVERSQPDPLRPGSCDTRVQAIAATSDAVRVSTEVERVATCTPFQWDDVMFLALLKSVER